MSSTYGLGLPAQRTGGRGAGLAGTALDQTQTATSLMGSLAQQETNRDTQYQQSEQARKSGNAQLGATAGALAGMKFGAAAGPWGMLIGGAIGAVAGRLF